MPRPPFGTTKPGACEPSTTGEPTTVAVWVSVRSASVKPKVPVVRSVLEFGCRERRVFDDDAPGAARLVDKEDVVLPADRSAVDRGSLRVELRRQHRSAAMRVGDNDGDRVRAAGGRRIDGAALQSLVDRGDRSGERQRSQMAIESIDDRQTVAQGDRRQRSVPDVHDYRQRIGIGIEVGVEVGNRFTGEFHLAWSQQLRLRLILVEVDKITSAC